LLQVEATRAPAFLGDPERYALDVAIEVDAELHLLPQSEGGRSGSIRPGYRSIMRFGTTEADPAWGVQIDFDGDDLAPGERRTVRVSTWADVDPPVSPGTPAWLYEGARLVGTATFRYRNVSWASLRE
jgi:hypothetical protein